MIILTIQTVVIIIMLLLVSLKSIKSNLEIELLQSLDRALQCPRPSPPEQPVIAMTPRRISQLVALIKTNIETPNCIRRLPDKRFSLEDETTWNFCVFGTCEENICRCLRTHTGYNCAYYKKKSCWMMYCFLEGCQPSVQSLYCSCNPILYGTKVLTGQYWYNNVNEPMSQPPPFNWKGKDFISKEGLNSQLEKEQGIQKDVIPSEMIRGGNISQDFYINSPRKSNLGNFQLKKTFTKTVDHNLIKINEKDDNTNDQDKTANLALQKEVTETKTNKETEDVKEALEEAVEESSAFLFISNEYFVLSIAALCYLYIFFIYNIILN